MGVKTFRIVRESLGWTRYKMAKELGISQTQYNYLEDKAVSTKNEMLIKLSDISGLPDGKFWKLFKDTEGS